MKYFQRGDSVLGEGEHWVHLAPNKSLRRLTVFLRISVFKTGFHSLHTRKASMFFSFIGTQTACSSASDEFLHRTVVSDSGMYFSNFRCCFSSIKHFNNLRLHNVAQKYFTYLFVYNLEERKRSYINKMAANCLLLCSVAYLLLKQCMQTKRGK